MFELPTALPRSRGDWETLASFSPIWTGRQNLLQGGSGPGAKMCGGSSSLPTHTPNRSTRTRPGRPHLPIIYLHPACPIIPSCSAIGWTMLSTQRFAGTVRYVTSGRHHGQAMNGLPRTSMCVCIPPFLHPVPPSMFVRLHIRPEQMVPCRVTWSEPYMECTVGAYSTCILWNQCKRKQPKDPTSRLASSTSQLRFTTQSTRGRGRQLAGSRIVS